MFLQGDKEMSNKVRYSVEWIEVFDEFGSHKYQNKIFTKKSEALEFLKTRDVGGKLFREEYLLEPHGEWYEWDIVGEPTFYDPCDDEFYN